MVIQVSHRSQRSARAWTASAVLILLTATATARAQGPQFDVGAPPGAAGGASTVGQPLGSADFPDFSTPSNRTLQRQTRPGRQPRPGELPLGTELPRCSGPPRRSQFAVQPIQEANVPAYGELDLPEEMEGPANGMTIDAAIELLVKQNLDLEAYRLEIPMADADLLTANLRANPIFYADTQLIPYGHYSFLRPGGPPQSDININYPLDVSFKRTARTRSARAARKVTEAQLQDAIRNSIDNLYTVYVDSVAAALTVKFSETYAKGTRQLLDRTERLFKGGQIKEADVLAVRAKLEIAELQVRESRQAKVKANRALALMLNLPLTDADKLEVRDSIGQVRRGPRVPGRSGRQGPGRPAGPVRDQDGRRASQRRCPPGQGERLPGCLLALSALYLPEQHLSRRAQCLFVDSGPHGHDSPL